MTSVTRNQTLKPRVYYLLYSTAVPCKIPSVELDCENGLTSPLNLDYVLYLKSKISLTTGVRLHVSLPKKYVSHLLLLRFLLRLRLTEHTHALAETRHDHTSVGPLGAADRDRLPHALQDMNQMTADW